MDFRILRDDNHDFIPVDVKRLRIMTKNLMKPLIVSDAI